MFVFRHKEQKLWVQFVSATLDVLLLFVLCIQVSLNQPQTLEARILLNPAGSSTSIEARYFVYGQIER